MNYFHSLIQAPNDKWFSREIRIIDTSTEKGCEKAEDLLANGHKCVGTLESELTPYKITAGICSKTRQLLDECYMKLWKIEDILNGRKDSNT